MAHLIDKDALVAEIERLTDELYDLLPDASKVENGNITISEACNTGKYTALESFRRFIDTIEVKEVDLKKEIDDAFLENKCNITDNVSLAEFMRIAKFFFELGIVASNKAQKGEKV